MNESVRPRADRESVIALLGQLHSFVPDARDAAIKTFFEMDQETVIGVLTSLSRSSDPELRCDSSEVLLRISARKTLPIVLPLLNDTDRSVRWHTCGLMHDFGDDRATAALTALLLNDSDGSIRFIAAWALGAVGGATAIPALKQAVALDIGTDPEGRRVADEAAEAIAAIASRLG
jgi:HEAT repeat protein